MHTISIYFKHIFTQKHSARLKIDIEHNPLIKPSPMLTAVEIGPAHQAQRLFPANIFQDKQNHEVLLDK